MLRRRYDNRIRLLLILLAILIALLCFELVRRLELPKLLEMIEYKAYDLRMSVPLAEGDHRPSPDIAIIVFDDPTLYLYEDEFGPWPWPRKLHADMVTFLNKVARPRLIAYDLLFLANKKGEERSDEVFVKTFLTHPNVMVAMNFDQFLDQTRSLGKELTAQQRALIRPMEIRLYSQLRRTLWNGLQLDETGFYNNNNLTFNNFRPLIAELYQASDRIYVINHARDEDGVSRSNPLFFRYKTRQPVKSEAGPYRWVAPQRYLDRLNRPVTAQGWLLDRQGGLIQQEQATYYPHMSLRMLEVLSSQQAAAHHHPWQRPLYRISADGTLQFGQHRVPLSRDGRFYINWYNVNVDNELWQQLLSQGLYPQLNQLLSQPPSPQRDQQLGLIKQQIARGEAQLRQPFNPKPYPLISGARVIEAMRHQQQGRLTDADRVLIRQLQRKILFIGSLAVSSFDMKTTPTSRVMPGIVQQAVLFDNLYQNNGFIHRVDPWLNRLIAIGLCLVAVVSVIVFRTAWMGVAAVVAAMVAFLCVNLILFKRLLLWVDLALPILAVLVVVTVAYVFKYMGRERDYQRTYKLATTDGLTGLHNHRFFQEFLQEAMATATRSNRPAALLLVDIDFFKKFNDNFGHQAGDMVLRAVAQKLQQSVRSDDLVARYGGEEMAIVLPDTAQEAALEVASKLVRLVAAEPYEIAPGNRQPVTISVGVAMYPTHGTDATSLIEFADEGLYRAKEAGRNCVGSLTKLEASPDVPKGEAVVVVSSPSVAPSSPLSELP